MEAFQTIRSAHFRELLRFAEAQQKVPIAYGRCGGEVTGATILYDPYPPPGESMEVQLDGGNDLVVGQVTEGCVYLNHDLDGILAGEVNVPQLAGEIAPGAFVSRVLDAVVEAAVNAYRNTIQRRRKVEYVRWKMAAVRTRITELNRDSNACASQIYEHEIQLERAWKRKLRIEQELEVLEGLTSPKIRNQAEEEFHLLSGLVPERLASVRFEEESVVAITHPVTIRYDDFEYQMGTFSIEVPLSVDGMVRIRSVSRVTDNTEYPHPHVSYDGTPCWGNFHSHLLECRMRGDLFHVVLLADDLLHSYNAASPYVRIERWNPDWEDQDVHEDCIQDADPFLDCVGCGDRNCPYWDSRFERCWENLEEGDVDQLERCVDCGLCGYHLSAADLLAELREEEEEEEETEETVTEEARP